MKNLTKLIRNHIQSNVWQAVWPGRHPLCVWVLNQLNKILKVRVDIQIERPVYDHIKEITR